jgi:hypothetical protein
MELYFNLFYIFTNFLSLRKICLNPLIFITQQRNYFFNKILNLNLNLFFSLSHNLFPHQLKLTTTRINSFSVLPSPFPTQMVSKTPTSMHEMIQPLPLIFRPIGKYENPPPTMFILLPFPTIIRSIRIFIPTHPTHLIFLPIPLISLKVEFIFTRNY